MDDFEVDIEGLRDAAAAAASAGDQAKQVHLGDGAAEVAEAMPGSASAAKADPLKVAWERRLIAWGNDLGVFSTELAAAADLYESDDAAAERDFSIVAGLLAANSS